MAEETHTCSETRRSFLTAKEARGSEARFREIQQECEAGRIPELRPGDVIYVDTHIYISHGCDDFRGGLADVLEMRSQISAGKPAPFVRVAQEPDSWHNWQMLAEEQKKLHAEHGTSWAHPDPDD